MPAMPSCGGASRGRPLRQGLARLALAAASLLAWAPPGQAQVAQINALSDVDFGAIADMGSDVSRNQTVCAYASGMAAGYSIKATGSGSGGAFTLTNGASTLAYDVQWNAAAGQISGTTLSAGSSLSGQVSPAVTPTCTLGLTPSGSLILVLRAASLASARAGSYSGALTLLVSPN